MSATPNSDGVAGVGRLDVALDRAGLRTPYARDAALAVALAIVTAVLLVPLTGSFASQLGLRLTPGQRASVMGLSAAQALALALRRVRPGLCLLLVTGLQVLLTVTVSQQATLRGVAPLIAVYTAGTCLPLRRLLRWAGVAVLVEIIGTPLLDALVGPALLTALDAGPTSGHLSAGTWVLSGLSVVLLYGVAAAAGVAVATRRENLTLLRARSEAVEQARSTDAQRAVAAERLRMARELHDIAAHHLTGLLVQASAAERLVGQDADAARGALLDVRDQGKQALDNLRTVVGMLRYDASSGPTELDPVPGLAVLPELVEQARVLGDKVDLEVEGTAYALPPVADVRAYRVTQEALSNARQHAAGQPVHLHLTYGEEAVALTVRNALSGPVRAGRRPGFGLAGMHERAALVHGTLSAGRVDAPTGVSAWEVALTLPRADVPSGPPSSKGEA